MLLLNWDWGGFSNSKLAQFSLILPVPEPSSRLSPKTRGDCRRKMQFNRFPGPTEQFVSMQKRWWFIPRVQPRKEIAILLRGYVLPGICGTSRVACTYLHTRARWRHWNEPRDRRLHSLQGRSQVTRSSAGNPRGRENGWDKAKGRFEVFPLFFLRPPIICNPFRL